MLRHDQLASEFIANATDGTDSRAAIVSQGTHQLWQCALSFAEYHKIDVWISEHLGWASIHMRASHDHWTGWVHGLGQGRDVQRLAIKRREQRRNANHVGVRLAYALAHLLPRQAVVPVMAKQFKWAQAP